MPRSRTAAVLLAGALCLAAGRVSAQSRVPSPVSPAFQPHPSALLAPSAPSPFEGSEASVPNILGQDNEGPRTSQAVALMIVGAAGIITGLAVDEDVIVVAGAAAAGIGLYLWLR